MSFGEPIVLLALLAVPAALGLYVLAQGRRTEYAARFTNLALLAEVAAARPGWRRHVPVAAYLLALAFLIFAVARPEADLTVAREGTSVVMTTDVSRSMEATDVEPTRMEAAKDAGLRFLDLLPDGSRVGVVAFSDTAQTLTRPTSDLDLARSAVENLQTVGGTAMGDGIQRALDDLEASGALGPDDTAAAFTPAQGEAPSIPPLVPEERPADPPPPARPPGTGPPASILLLSDGENTVGSDPIEAGRRARELGVPIFAIALGTDEGQVTVPDQFGRPTVVDVPPDRETLRRLVQMTGGAYYEAPDDEELREVYEELSATVGTTTETREITAAFAGAALAMVLIGGLLSLWWFGRFP